MKNLPIKNKRGFTIFFAVLVASLSLSVGLVIYDLLVRQLTLSQVVTQSQYAIYAADTGAECALYWDLKFTDIAPSDADGSAFATSSHWVSGGTADGMDTVECNGQDIALTNPIISNTPKAYAAINDGWDIEIAAPTTTTTFWISMGTAAAPCAKVEVSKQGNPSQTTIVSHGYNTCGGGLRLERSLQINY